MTARAQNGFSLIELMVSMLLGSLLIAGLVGVFLASSKNYRTSNALSEVQDKGRYALKVIRRDVNEAGFLALGDKGTGVLPIELKDGLCGLNGQADVLKMESPGLSNTERCYYIENNILKRKQTISGAASTATIIDGVLDYQFRFALDTNGDGSVDADSSNVVYFASSTSLDWSSVRAVKLDLLVSSNTEHVTDNLQLLNAPFSSKKYGGAAGTAAGKAPDNKLYQIFTGVFAVRNRVE